MSHVEWQKREVYVKIFHLSPSLCFSVHFSTWTWVSRFFIDAKDDGTGGDNWSFESCKLQSHRCHQQTNTQLFTGGMPFLSFNQQCQSTGVSHRATVCFVCCSLCLCLHDIDVKLDTCLHWTALHNSPPDQLSSHTLDSCMTEMTRMSFAHGWQILHYKFQYTLILALFTLVLIFVPLTGTDVHIQPNSANPLFSTAVVSSTWNWHFLLWAVLRLLKLA